MKFSVQSTRWVKRASGERVAQLGFGPLGRIRELRVDEMHAVAVTGLGEAPRVLDGFGRLSLNPAEHLVLRHGIGDWWFVPAQAIREAFERAFAELRAIVVDDSARVRAVALPADAAERDAAMARLTAGRGR